MKNFSTSNRNKQTQIFLSALSIFFALVLFSNLSSAVSWNASATNMSYVVMEDTPYSHNFTANVTEPASDMVFAVDTLNQILLRNGVQIDYSVISSWVYFTNSTLGLCLFNATNDSQTGNFSIPIKVSFNSGSSAATTSFLFNITPVNDAPVFSNLPGNITINKSLYELILQATDEENDLDFTFNVSFLSCIHTAQNPPTGAANCTLFNLTSYNGTATNISFTPTDNQKGEYIINFSVKDARNATRSELVNWTLTWNDHPYFTYVCNSERNATENAPFSCFINATDTDELHNLTFTSNYTWFTFNGTATNSTTVSNITLGNFSAMVNFTANDSMVGNWSVNVTITDTGATNSSALSNSTVFWFYIANVNDSVSLSSIPDQIAYTSINKTVEINASDDDLLIPDKSVYNEVLTFTSNNSNVTVQTSTYVSGTNRTNATLLIDTAALGAGNHSINITVRDANNFSIDSDIFVVNITGNNAPVWNSQVTNYLLTEDTAFSLNLSGNVTDANAGDTITFSSTVNNNEYDADFPNFNINSTTGVISFTPRDLDVGYWNVTITATDGKTPSSLNFNFTVLNVVDTPYILIPPIIQYNVTADSNFRNVNVTEDNYTRIKFSVEDDDFRVQQPAFYTEDHIVTTIVQGPNITLVVFDDPGKAVDTPSCFDESYCNLSQPEAIFTPRKTDVGNYNITLNITDAGGASASHAFNLTVLPVDHSPNLTKVDNQIFSILNETFYINVNVTDLEDGNDTANVGNFTFVLTNLTTGGNFLTINSTTGVINFTFNQTYAGLWQYLLTVNDTDGDTDTDLFNVTVYDYPRISSPLTSYQFNLVENVTSQLNFTANHTVGDNLNYTLIINGRIRNSTLGYGNGTAFLWNFTANFTDETACSGVVNITLNVSNSKLSNSTSWNLTVNHTDYPLTFSNSIADQSGGSPITLALSSYYIDYDASDVCINQTINFAYRVINGSTSGGTITVVATNWVNATNPTINFSATTASGANYTIYGLEYNQSNSSQLLRNVSSNNFSVQLTVSPTETPAATTSSGGGGGSSTTIVSLKILVPEPVSAKQKDRLVIPLGLWNDGDVDLSRIQLAAVIAKDGLLRKDLVASFDRSYFDRLDKGDRENVTMIVDIDTDATGLFEVTINATVESPEYSDWAKFFIEINKEEDILERIIFTEEFIIGNPECAEFVDLIDDAKSLFALGKTAEALQKSEESLDACKVAISQPPRPRLYERIGDKFFTYAAIASLLAFAIGFGYYYYQKIKLKRQLRGY